MVGPPIGVAPKELLDYKIESEKKIENLENQLDVMKVKLAKEFVSLEKVLERKQGNIISIQTDVKGLKNEFALLKHTNQDKPDLKGDVQQPVQQKEFKCDQCNVAFKTENGVKVHKEIAHINLEPVKIKCKYCNYKTVVSAMENHVENIHKFRCLKCNYCPVVHSQDRLDYHMRLAHGEN